MKAFSLNEALKYFFVWKKKKELQTELGARKS